MCAKFVTAISKTRPEYVEHLSRLASIGLLTEVVDDFIKPTQPAVKSDLIIALDAPIALDLLGCSGHTIKDDLKILYEALTTIGCAFVVFPITCQEMAHNLQAMLGLPPNKRHGLTHAAICKGEIREDYVESVARDPVAALKRAGVQLRSANLDYLPSSHVYFNDKRHDDFFSEVTWVEDYEPREHDATCMTLIMRLRATRHSSDALRCGYVFMTRNPQFVERSREYCLKERLINALQQGPLIHQCDLFTVAWLRTGLGIQDIVPRGHLLATCDRVLQVRTEVRNAVAARLRQIKPDELEQFEVLLADHRCLQTLADQTLNNEKEVTTKNVGKILEMMRKSMVSDVRHEYEQKLGDAQKKVQELEAQLAKMRAESGALEKDHEGRGVHQEDLQDNTKSTVLNVHKRDLLNSTKFFSRR